MVILGGLGSSYVLSLLVLPTFHFVSGASPEPQIDNKWLYWGCYGRLSIAIASCRHLEGAGSEKEPG
jgi:hypothetical protein